MIGRLKKSKGEAVKGYYFRIGEVELKAIDFLKKNNFNIAEVLRSQLRKYVADLNEKEYQNEIKK
jgi:hypothetical protein